MSQGYFSINSAGKHQFYQFDVDFISRILVPCPSPPNQLHYRLATPADIPRLRALIDLSVRQLQARDYTTSQIDQALQTYLSLDTQLIADQTYFVVEDPTGAPDAPLVASGGWSKRRTLCGGDTSLGGSNNPAGRDSSLLDPANEAAKIRAFYVHPGWARRGIGSKILELCENAALAAGFTRFEMGATLTGVPLYARHGYLEVERLSLPLADGDSLAIVRMVKGN
jgi:GNAT superfamily N-acetyltransferase